MSLETGLRVGEVRSVPVVSADITETADRLAERMLKADVGSVVIKEGGRAVGIVTEGDLARKVVAARRVPWRVRARDVMSSPLQTIEESADIPEAARKMRRLKVKRLGVTRGGELVGMISVSDLAALSPELMEVLSQKARLLTGETIRGRPCYDGYCDNCERWSDRLLEVDGKFLCEECRGES
jgi:CBS domain-containing protein